VRVCLGGPQEADKSQFGQAVKEQAKETRSDKELPFIQVCTFFCNGHETILSLSGVLYGILNHQYLLSHCSFNDAAVSQRIQR